MRKSAAALLLFWISFCAWSGQIAYCPETIRASYSPVEPNEIPANAHLVKTTKPQQLRVKGAGLYAGPPEDSAALVSEYTQTKDGSIERWHLDVNYAAGHYVGCDYADGLVELAVKLPVNANACTAEYRNGTLFRFSCTAQGVPHQGTNAQPKKKY